MDPTTTSDAAEVTVYTLPGCLYCAAARRRLRRRGIEFDEVSGEGQSGFRDFLLRRTGGSSVPQILIDAEPIGGSDKLARLDRKGVLLPRASRVRFPIVLTKRRLALLGGRFVVRVVDSAGEVLESTRTSSREETRSLAESLEESYPPGAQAKDGPR